MHVTPVCTSGYVVRGSTRILSAVTSSPVGTAQKRSKGSSADALELRLFGLGENCRLHASGFHRRAGGLTKKWSFSGTTCS